MFLQISSPPPKDAVVYYAQTTSFHFPQDESTGEITFYMKGADVVMAGIVQYNDWLEEEVSAHFKGNQTFPCVRPMGDAVCEEAWLKYMKQTGFKKLGPRY